MKIDARPTSGAPDDDPYLWLEDIDGTDATAWADAESARTLAAFGGPSFEADRNALLTIYDAPDKMPYITRRGGLIYNFWKDENNPHGIWRRTTFPSFQSDTPEWDTLIDVDALAAEEDEDWIWSGATVLHGTLDRVMVRLSRGGGDAVMLREFDLETRSFVQNDAFHLEEAKGGSIWLDRDTVLLQSSFGGPAFETTSGYGRTVRLWKRGQSVLDAEILFEVPNDHMSAYAAFDTTADKERILFVDIIGFFDYAVHIGDRNGPEQRIDVPTNTLLYTHRDWIVVKPREDWTVDGAVHPADTLLGASLSALLHGEKQFTTIFKPEPRRTLDGFMFVNDHLILSVLDNLKPEIYRLSPSAGAWKTEKLDALPDVGIVSVGPLDKKPEESNGDLIATAQDPLTPPTMLFLDAKTDLSAPTVLKRAPAHFDPSGLVVSQHEAISIDGEHIPYTQVGPTETNGNAPVHMSGYGGFGISRLATYNASIGKMWLERGGVSVTAHIRGGGEFGTPWHDAGRGAGKALTHDDFAAIAAHLVERGITQPERIAAEGGSNGGILISNMLTRYPERFGALFCTIPLIDMRRYTKLLAGASWIAEYGDPDKSEDWEHLKTYSAYHAAEPHKKYPPILLATARRDDRVHPGHARKMTAKLHKMGYDAWFYEPAAGGHGYGKDNAEQAAFVSLGYNFLRQKIGWT